MHKPAIAQTKVTDFIRRMLCLAALDFGERPFWKLPLGRQAGATGWAQEVKPRPSQAQRR